MGRRADRQDSFRPSGESKVRYREEPRPSDAEIVRKIVESSGFFSPPEIEVAIELVNERLSKGESSGYYFLFAEIDGKVAGYACYGPIPCTVESWDIYWIAVQEDFRRSGMGREILRRVEAKIKGMGGTRIYVETASKEQYNPTRAFYRGCGYEEEAVLRDFYSPGDAKVIYLKVIP